jgi:indole-3-glycerol phosphate synthase
MGVLQKILASKRSELEELRRRPLPEPPEPRAIELSRAVTGQLSLITEIKRRSPSAGELSRVLSVGERARVYEEGGASMLSILCDGPFFAGDYADLDEARRATSIPILCKEFVIDPCQLDAARAFGADAVLLIVRCLPGTELETLIQAALARDLTPLVEIFSEQEAERALDAGASLIGVNARDLDTLEMDVPRAQRILESLPDSVCRLHLSGVKDAQSVRGVSPRADAALLGETLMREDDPGPRLRELAAAARDKVGAG